MEKSTEETPANENDSMRENRAIIVYSRSLVEALSTADGRLEPTYVGVRRVRPSSRIVKQALDADKKKKERDAMAAAQAQLLASDVGSTNNNIEGQATMEDGDTENAAERKVSTLTFKVVGDDGVERRMTKQEKKAVKLQIAQQKKLEKEQRRLEKEKNNPPPAKKGRKRKRNNKREPVLAKTVTTEDHTNNTQGEAPDATVSRKNGGCDVNSSDSIGDDMKALSQVGIPAPKLSLIEQELADLRGARQGVPPVILSAPLAHAALRTPGFLPGNKPSNDTSTSDLWVDDDLAQEWVTALSESMIPALDVRGREDMRPLAYDIIPEVWSRLRPESMRAGRQPDKPALETSTTNHCSQDQVLTAKDHEQSWGLIPIRPSAASGFDSELAAVTEILHQNTPLYVSCGAKFGCDLLLYDGPRKERHAFGGLRLVSAATNDHTKLPVPSAYSIAGYVRCLNTAGKLALLALVKRDRQPDGSTRCRIAFVDLKLQRVDGTKRKGTDERLQKLTRA